MSRCTPQPPAGTAHLPLTTLKLAHSNASDAMTRGSLAGFFGRAGTGKTYAVETWVDKYKPHYGWVTATPSPGPKEIFEELIYAVTGIIPTGTKVQMRRECQALLRDQRPVIIVDEAQNLSHLWLRQLRDLYDRGEGTFAMFLVGGDGCAKRLKSDPMLWKRVTYKTWFTHLEGVTLASALAEYHPLLAATDRRILEAIDRRAEFKGNLRDWANFVDVVSPLADRVGTHKLDEKIVRATFAKMGIKA
jgi:DNA transposition AAA+ family ATPase